MAFSLPASVSQLISRLESAGYEAYAVGGCVRDMLCGRTPHDWDLCTSAMPWETKACFPDCTVLTIGEKHGTITVLWNGEPYEITTYRVDGTYTDCRRPEEVTFVRSLEEDLRRRDFTMNAMAYHPERGLVDLCGGRDDLAAGVLRCVGDPERRFSEDALRILRGLRFAACYRLALELETAAAAVRLAPLLGRIAVERIDTEFQKLLLADGDAAAEILRQYPTVWNTIFPEFLPMQQCLQHNPYHQYDVWEHTLHVLENAPHDIILRWAALLHDVGKPACRFTGADGIDHFYGHAEKSAEMSRQILRLLHADHTRIHDVCTLVAHHDMPLSDSPRFMRRLLAKLGETQVRRLLALKRADDAGKADGVLERREAQWTAAENFLEQLLAENACLRVKDLAVGGADLLALGIPQGKQIGKILHMLLEQVLDDKLPNEREVLLHAVPECRKALSDE